MEAPELILTGRRVVTPDGVRPAAVLVAGGRILGLSAPGIDAPDAEMLDLGDRVLFPGVVDVHVHVNEPGRTEWEGFATATRAAAAGGTTTLFDMPLNSLPVTTTRAALGEKLAAARQQSQIDVGFWGGLVPANANDPDELAGLLGCGLPGVKCFLIDSGIPEFPAVGESELRSAMPIIKREGGVLLVHAELACAASANAIGPPSGAPRDSAPREYATFLESRPPAMEEQAIAMVTRLAAETGCRVHIVHLSAASALPELARARARGVPITVETCPHYLSFTAEAIAAGQTQHKCCPPIREAANREALWQGLADGVIDLVASDHSPCLPSLKLPEAGDFMSAWGGISSVQLLLAATWSEAQRRGFSLMHLANWLCTQPAKLAGLAGRKGAIAPGHDADFVVWNPDHPFHVEPAALYHRHKVTPYAGQDLRGQIETTFLRGQRVYDRGDFPTHPRGRLLMGDKGSAGL